MRKFNIKGLSQAIWLSEFEIKHRLGLPLKRACSAETSTAAKLEFFSASKGSAKKMAALTRWVEFFLEEVKLVQSSTMAIHLFNNAPPDANARQIALETVAFFYGFSETISYQVALNTAQTMRSAIKQAFKHLPLGKSFVGPKKKLLICRNEVKLGPGAEVLIKTTDPDDTRILFAAYWKDNVQGYKLKSNWAKTDKFEDWNHKW